jgi:hypothetical protein
MLQQKNQYLKRLVLQLQLHAVLPQFPPVRIYFEDPELKGRLLLLDLRHTVSP